MTRLRIVQPQHLGGHTVFEASSLSTATPPWQILTGAGLHLKWKWWLHVSV